MKTLTNKLIAIIIITCFIEGVSFASELNYKLTISNLNYTSDKSLEFDIYLLNTSSGKGEFNYSLGQYFLEFNPKIANGGVLIYSIVSSELPESMRPRNASVFENQLRLACNSLSSRKDNLPVVPNEEPGLLIARMKLETSSDKFSSEPLNLNWTDDASKYKTKIFAFDGKKNIEITNSSNHSINGQSQNGIAQNRNELPTEYSLSQNYPNPFNPTTQINFSIPNTQYTILKVYDITGRAVATLVNERLDAGRYEVTFGGSNFASGVYFYKIKSGDYSKVMRMMLIK